MRSPTRPSRGGPGSASMPSGSGIWMGHRSSASRRQPKWRAAGPRRAAHVAAIAEQLRAAQAQATLLHGRLGAAEGALTEAQRGHDRVLGELSVQSRTHAETAAHVAAITEQLRAAQAQTTLLHGRLGAAEGALKEAQRGHDRVLGELSALSRTHADHVAALERAATDATRTIAARESVIAERDAQIAERDAQLADGLLAERDQHITGLDVQIAERNAQLAERDRRFEEAQRWQHELMSELAGTKTAYQELASGYQAVTGSWSWRITAPLRTVRSRLRHGRAETRQRRQARGG